MGRLVTLFTGQWADLPFEVICQKAKDFGYYGLELACWGDHFDVEKAAGSDDYCQGRWDILTKHGLDCQAISSHLVGQATCDVIDERHKAILPPEIWGDGMPHDVQTSAINRMKLTAKACRRFMDLRPGGPPNRCVVNGFTGSSIWHLLYSFPPVTPEMISKGYQKFSRIWSDILKEFGDNEVYFALEVHPTEIAFDIASAMRTLEALEVSAYSEYFGFNFDPSHLGYQGVDYVKFIRTFPDSIFHVHMKDVWWGHGDGTVGVFGGHVPFGDPRRYWDFRSLGHGDIKFEDIIVALNDVGYQGPLSVEWEDSRMDREHGATEAAAFVKRIDFKPSAIAFDAQFDR